MTFVIVTESIQNVCLLVNISYLDILVAKPTCIHSNGALLPITSKYLVKSIYENIDLFDII